MAEAAKKLDYAAPPPVVAPVSALPLSDWSGEVHGPVAALHQAIEAGFADLRPDPWLVIAEPVSPVDRLLRHASRATGWTVLAVAFAATAHAIF